MLDSVWLWLLLLFEARLLIPALVIRTKSELRKTEARDGSSGGAAYRLRVL